MVADKSILHQHCTNYQSIDWVLLGKASEFYSSMGYVQVETPWMLPLSYMVGTKPHSDPSFQTSSGLFSNQPHELVGSAEQGFGYWLAHNQLIEGRYFSVSPCFRVEQFDQRHKPWFMKLELFIYSSNEEQLNSELFAMIDQCMAFFKANSSNSLELVQYGDSYDIEMHGVELGSYGIRDSNYGRYVYGTGLALPRFNYVY